MTGGTRRSQPTHQGSPQTLRSKHSARPRGPHTGCSKRAARSRHRHTDTQLHTPLRHRHSSCTQPHTAAHLNTHPRHSHVQTQHTALNVATHSCTHGESQTRGHTRRHVHTHTAARTYGFTWGHRKTTHECTPTQELYTDRATHTQQRRARAHGDAPSRPASQPCNTITCSETHRAQQRVHSAIHTNTATPSQSHPDAPMRTASPGTATSRPTHGHTHRTEGRCVRTWTEAVCRHRPAQ